MPWKLDREKKERMQKKRKKMIRKKEEDDKKIICIVVIPYYQTTIIAQKIEKWINFSCMESISYMESNYVVLFIQKMSNTLN